jgi:hypothetical protein
MALKAAATLSDLGLDEKQAAGERLDLAESPVSLWLAEPSTRGEGTGLLRTADGQSFVLGGSSGFELARMNGQELVIRTGDQEILLTLDKVYALNLPQ